MHLEALSNAFGVSSVEDEVRNLIVEAARPYADDIEVDTMGNLFITRKPRSEPRETVKRVMVTAHMDEVGFMISEIKENGLLKFKTIGGFDRRVLLGKTVVVGEERVPGVLGIKPIHLADSMKVGDIDSMSIDIGASSKSNGKVKAGDFATFATEFAHLGNPTEPSLARGRVKGKAMDNRVGCAMLLELLKGAYPHEIVAVFTVQEELGLRGARVAGYTAQPDVAFILECTAADDLPRDEDEEGDVEQSMPRLGDGPAISVKDSRFIADRRLVDLLVNTAESAGIPYQFRRADVGGGTDAGAIYLAREGVPSVVVSTPARYIHSPAAIVDLEDFWHGTGLLTATLQALP